MYKGYLIDLDGTAYLGTKVIPETITFTDALNQKKIPFKFVTNNSSATESDVVKKLTNMGYTVGEENICTTARATSNYIQKYHKGCNAYVIGSGGLLSALKDANVNLVDGQDCKLVDVVIIGLDKNVDYEKFARACLAVRNGAVFISTNPDIALPSERGMLPGNGSLVELVAHSTQVTPITIGKPEKHIMQEALEQLNLAANEVAMIGDNYNTDIMSGINMKIDTIFVNTGLTTKEELGAYQIKPTHICETLLDFLPNIDNK